MSAAEPLWREALIDRARAKVASFGASHGNHESRLALHRVLARAGAHISLMEIHAWPRHRQGEAYLWAVAFVAGREDLPPPPFLFERMR